MDRWGSVVVGIGCQNWLLSLCSRLWHRAPSDRTGLFAAGGFSARTRRTPTLLRRPLCSLESLVVSLSEGEIFVSACNSGRDDDDDNENNQGFVAGTAAACPARIPLAPARAVKQSRWIENFMGLVLQTNFVNRALFVVIAVTTRSWPESESPPESPPALISLEESLPPPLLQSPDSSLPTGLPCPSLARPVVSVCVSVVMVVGCGWCRRCRNEGTMSGEYDDGK